jgi:hypothetical protein
MPLGSGLSRLNNWVDCATVTRGGTGRDFVYVQRQNGWRPTQKYLQSLWEQILANSPTTAREVEWVRVDATHFVILFKDSKDGSAAAKKCIECCFSNGWKTFEERDFVLILRGGYSG